ncbi:hypothetical protein [Methylobacterium radiotolerans]|uniref:hypothetical protein n=1 Tax=Methylobacterium radiotolerans TaxID=31998 RepID=UPI000B248841|nr:hypothetical protein [Methylobacterium radiotolerans]GEN00857.1 hypothetical protein MRA01_53960 [Methylobacterium radiotolerans]
MPLRGTHSAGPVKPIDVPKSKVLIGGTQIGLGLQTAAIACVMSKRGRSSIGVANRIDTVWSMARHAAATLPEFARKPDEVRLVQDYLRTEVSADFELIATLEHGVGVHHAGLSDEIRTLMEWLAEAGHLRVCVQPRPSRKASISPFRPYSRHRVTFRKMDARSRCLRASSGI